jgi:hypothetical protein
MFTRCLGVLLGLWSLDDAFSPDLFDYEADPLSSRSESPTHAEFHARATRA